jgi:hypothetical protein
MSDLNLKAVLDLSIGSITRGRAAERELAKQFGAAAAEGVQKGLKEGARKATGEMERVWTKLLDATMVDAGKELRKTFKEGARLQEKTIKELASVENQLQRTRDESVKKGLRQRKIQLQREIKLQQKAQKNLLENAERAAERRLEVNRAHEERMHTLRMESGEKFANLINSSLSLDQLDPSSFVDGILSGLSSAATMGAGALAAGGKAGAAAQLGTVAASLTAVAAPIVALVGVLTAAMEGSRAMNAAFMESYSAADVLAGQFDTLTAGAGALAVEYNSLQVRLSMLRRASIDLAYDYRLSKEEVISYTNALADAGFTFGEFRAVVKGSTSDIQALSDVTRVAILSSQGLGISASETSEFINRMYEDLGADLTGIQGAFGMIFSEARKAGMSTKDFFSTINQASSGMALYNFRIGDTVGLLSDMVEILGDDLAKANIALEGQFRGQTMTSRIKSTMLMGTGRAQSIARADALAQGRQMGTVGGMDLGSEAGLRQLANLTGRAFRDTLRDVEDPAQRRQLITLRELAQSMKGGLVNVAESLGSLSKTGELAAQLSQGAALLGGRGIGEASGMQRAMIEEALGISGEQFEVLKRLDIGLRSEFERMQESDKTLTMSFEEALASGLLSQSDMLQQSAELQYSLMERTAQEQLRETRSMTQTMSNVIAGLLENISVGINHLVTLFENSFLFRGDSTLEGRRQSLSNEEAARSALDAISNELLNKRSALTAEEDPGKRAALAEEISALEDRAAQERDRISREQKIRSRISMGESPGSARQAVAEEMFRQRFGQSATGYAEGLGADQLSALGISKYRVRMGGGGMPRSPGEALGMQDVIRRLNAGEMSRQEAEALGFEVALNPLQKLSEEQIEVLTSQAEENRRQEQEIADNQEKKQEATTDAVNQLLETMRQEQLAKLTGATGLSARKLQNLLQQGFAGEQQIVSAVRGAVGGGGITEMQAREYLGLLNLEYGAPMNDFIYQGGRGGRARVTPISSQDDFYGAKPGGPVLEGKAPVTININGGDEARVYRVVKDVLDKTGYNNRRTYGG